jgi:hydrogenase maturation protease
MPGKALIIGYGNPLRGDDGIGQAAAEALANDDRVDRCRVIACHQLTPELAECIAKVDLVVFVDAAVNVQPGMVVACKIRGALLPSSGLAHTTDPAALLHLATTLYGGTSEAFLVKVGVTSMTLGDGLSAAAAEVLPNAVATIRRLVAEHLGSG